MYNPAGDNQPLEWIELHNQTSIDVDLSDWKISDAVNYQFATGTTIAAGSYLVVAADASALQAATGFSSAIGSYTGNLSNGGESIVLLDHNNRLMDQLDYDDEGDWPIAPDGSGATLAKRSPHLATASFNSWQASPNVGGTPGAANSFSVGDTLVTATLLDDGAPAKAFIPTNNDLGASWTGGGEPFDDSSWVAGTTGIGFDTETTYDSLIDLDLTAMQGVNPGSYIRIPFDVNDPSAISELTLDMRYDDGFVAYLNGVEIAKRNSPTATASDTVALYELGESDTGASAGIGGSNPTIAAVGTDATIGGGNPTYSANTPGLGSALSMNFDNSFDHYTTGSPVDLGADNWGMEAWVYSADLNNDGWALANGRYFLGQFNGNFLWHRNGQGNVNTVNIPVAQEEWHHMALVRESGVLTAYFDGIALASQDRTDTWDFNFAIGTGGSTGAETWAGNVDHARLFTFDAGQFNPATDLSYNALVAGGGSGELNYASVATTDRPDIVALAPELIDISSHIGLLRVGENVLALHGLNSSAGDSDFLVAPKILALQPSSEHADILINEVAGAADASFFVELHNIDDQPQDLSGFTIAATGDTGGSYTIPSGTIPAGGYLSFDEVTLGFDPQDESRLFLYNADDTEVLDAVRVKNTLRGRSDQHDGHWQRPDIATPAAANSFTFHDEIVINEILYHHFPVQPTDEVVQSTTVVEFDDTWRYNQSGTNLGANWATSFHSVDNVNWFAGDGLLAQESAPLPEPTNTSLNLGPTTFYFETEFDFSGNLADVDELRLSHIVDDGAVFYLNGVEIWRHNIPGNPGDPVSASTFANPGVTDATSIGPITLPANELIVGSNRLSVEVHQASAGSTDVVMGTELSLVEVATQGTLFSEDPEEWIELYNNSTQAVDLSGWQLDDAVSFTFADGTTLAPGAFAVIARDAAALALKYPSVTIAGEYSGKLSNSDERIQLLDGNKNIADEVHYYDRGRWSDLADGGSSSLELRDPDADNSIAEAWGPSDESGDASWQTVTYSGVATTPAIGNALWNEFVFGMLDDGEILIDDISVIQDPNGTANELIQNGDFDSGLSTWRAGGNHQHVEIVGDPDNLSNNVLHLTATGPAEHLYNHIETTLVGNTAIQPGTEYKISYRVRSLSGSNQLNTRLYFNYLPHTELLQRDRNDGTPGAVNSIAESNIGPTYQNLTQSVITPTSSQSVTIQVDAEDPDNVSTMRLWYAANEGAWQSLLMSNTTGTTYEGTIPGFSSGTIVQFYVEGTDGLGASSTFPDAGVDSRALYEVGGGASGSLNSLQIIMLPSEATELVDLTRIMSNDLYGATVVVDGEKIHYDVGTRLKGSFSGRFHNVAKGFHVRFDPMDKYHGIHNSLSMNQNNLLQDGLGHHLLQVAGEGVVGIYNDAIRFVSPVSSVSDGNWLLLLARHTDVYLDSQFENGGDGGVFNVEASYQPTTTIDGTPESLKEFIAGQWTFAAGEPDFVDYGDDPEVYRYFFQLENARRADDYSGLLDLNSIFNQSGQALYQAALQILDVDQWVRSFAAQSIIGNDDVVTQPNLQHNFKVYQRPEDGKFLAMFWDLDRAFRVSTNAPLWGSSGQLHRLFEIPQVTRLFHGHVDHLIQTDLNSSYVSTWESEFASLFGSGGSHIQAPATYVQNRSNSILGQLPSLTPFAITTNGGADFTTSASQVTIGGTGSYKIRDIRLNGNPTPLEVVWTGETTWEATIPVGPGANSLNFGAHDYFGTEIHTDSITVTSTTTVPLASAADLRISELNYHPYDPLTQFGDANVDDGLFEFVELVNTRTTGAIELQGVSFTDGFTFAFSVSTTLDAGERILVVRDQVAFESRYGTGHNIAGQFTSGGLSNSSESIKLEDAGGGTILEFTYEDGGRWPGRADGKGATLEVIDTEGDYNSPENWQSSNEFHGTPGTAGSGPVFDVIVNEVLSHSDGAAPDKIELYNTSAVEIDLEGWHLTDDHEDYFKFTFGSGSTIAAGGYLVLDESQLGFALDGQLGDDIWLVQGNVTGKPTRFADHHDLGATAANGTLGRWANGDPSGALVPMAHPSLGSANPGPMFGDLLITEIHYNPDAVPPAEAANISQSELEFVELFNNRNSTLDVSNWKLDGVDFTFPAGTTLAAGEAIVVVTFDPTVGPAKATAFRNVFGVGASVQLLGPAMGQLENAGEQLTLSRPEDGVTLATGDILVDTVRYDDAAPWPTTADGSGSSLTRVARTSFTPLVSSWTAASPTPGSATFASLPSGDYDRNGMVNAIDYQVWKYTFGQQSTPANNNNLPSADGNGDGVVNAIDYAVWRDHLGEVANVPPPLALPADKSAAQDNEPAWPTSFSLIRSSDGSALDLVFESLEVRSTPQQLHSPHPQSLYVSIHEDDKYSVALDALLHESIEESSDNNCKFDTNCFWPTLLKLNWLP